MQSCKSVPTYTRSACGFFRTTALARSSDGAGIRGTDLQCLMCYRSRASGTVARCIFGVANQRTPRATSSGVDIGVCTVAKDLHT